jgi:hypothetical protein
MELGRTLWNVVDVMWAVVLIVSLFGGPKKEVGPEREY